MRWHGRGLDELRLRAATVAVLRRARIDSLDELATRTPADLCAIPSLDSAMLAEIVAALGSRAAATDTDQPVPGAVGLEWDLDTELAPNQRTDTEPAACPEAEPDAHRDAEPDA